MSEARSERRVKENWSEVSGIFQSFLERETFDLSLPCVLITPENNVLSASVSSISSHLKASEALSSAPVLEVLERAELEGTGVGAVVEEVLNSDDGEEFAELWDQATSDVANGARCSIDDVVRIIHTAKRGWESDPRQMVVVDDDGDSLEVGLVGLR